MNMPLMVLAIYLFFLCYRSYVDVHIEGFLSFVVIVITDNDDAIHLDANVTVDRGSSVEQIGEGSKYRE